MDLKSNSSLQNQLVR